MRAGSLTRRRENPEGLTGLRGHWENPGNTAEQLPGKGEQSRTAVVAAQPGGSCGGQREPCRTGSAGHEPVDHDPNPVCRLKTQGLYLGVSETSG